MDRTHLAESGKFDLSDEEDWRVWKNYQEIFAIFSVFFIEMDIVWHRVSDKKLLEFQMKYFLCVSAVCCTFAIFLFTGGFPDTPI